VFILQASDSMLLGNLQKGSLDIIGAVVELTMSERPDLEWILRIQNPNTCSVFEAAAPSKDTALEWLQIIHETGQNASVRVNFLSLSFITIYFFIYISIYFSYY
jgi:phosphatidylinositol phospholipase C gamma-1